MEEMEKERMFHKKTRHTEEVTIPAGVNGYYTFSIAIEVNEKIAPRVLCGIDVHQPPNRTDLNIGFYVIDDQNYNKWLAKQPHTAIIIIPRITHAGIVFIPPETGTYHIVFDNRYSNFTKKTVSFEIIEFWTEEKRTEKPIVEKSVKQAIHENSAEETIATNPPEIGGLISQLINEIKKWLQNKTFIAVVLFFFSMGVSALAFIGSVYLIHISLGITPKDAINQIGNSSLIFFTGGLILFGLSYKSLTGEQIPMVTSPSVKL